MGRKRGGMGGPMSMIERNSATMEGTRCPNRCGPARQHYVRGNLERLVPPAGERMSLKKTKRKARQEVAENRLGREGKGEKVESVRGGKE